MNHGKLSRLMFNSIGLAIVAAVVVALFHCTAGGVK